MSLELLIGVPHLSEVVNLADRIIKNRYPRGPESLMLELPKWCADSTGDVEYPFFSELEHRYKSRLTRIVYGDLCRAHLPKRLKHLKAKDFDLLDQLIHIGFNLYDLCGIILNTHIGERRYLGLIEVIEKEKPQVAVVGRAHANHIKKVFPNVYYVAIVPPDIHPLITRVMKPWINPYKPDEVIKLGFKKST